MNVNNSYSHLLLLIIRHVSINNRVSPHESNEIFMDIFGCPFFMIRNAPRIVFSKNYDRNDTL